jgi:hypothetical protein
MAAPRGGALAPVLSAILKERSVWAGFSRVRYLLEAMRIFHYMVGITTPAPQNEKKILFLWIGIILALALLAVSVAFFLIPRVLG